MRFMWESVQEVNTQRLCVKERQRGCEGIQEWREKWAEEIRIGVSAEDLNV